MQVHYDQWSTVQPQHRPLSALQPAADPEPLPDAANQRTEQAGLLAGPEAAEGTHAPQVSTPQASMLHQWASACLLLITLKRAVA